MELMTTWEMEAALESLVMGSLSRRIRPNWCYNHAIILNRKNDRATCVARILVQCLDVLCETVTRKKKSQNKLRGLDDNANLQQKILRSLFWPQKHSCKYRIISPCCTIQTGRSDLKYLLYKRRSKCRCFCLVSNLYFRDGLLFFLFVFFFCARVHLKACRGWLNLFTLPKDHSMFFQFSVCANFCWWKKPATATRTMMTYKIRELYVIF